MRQRVAGGDPEVIGGPLGRPARHQPPLPYSSAWAVRARVVAYAGSTMTLVLTGVRA